MFVLRRNEDGRFVAAPGSASSYTVDLMRARIFATREAADVDRCGNETIIDARSLLQSPR